MTPERKRTCGTCGLAEFEMTVGTRPRPRREHAGDCRWQLIRAAPLPLAVKLQVMRSPILPEMIGCPCWVAKGGAK